MSELKRIAVRCIFRGWGRSRSFTTPGNFEAFNMLMNKLDKKKIKDTEGLLVFEFREKK